MKTEQKHSPTPWEVSKIGYSAGILSPSAKRRNKTQPFLVLQAGMYCDCNEAEASQNAAFIVRAVNAHDELVSALKGMVALWESNTPENEGRCGCSGSSDDCRSPGLCDYCAAKELLKKAGAL